MNDNLVHLLTTYDTEVRGGVRYMLIPLTDILNKSIRIDDDKQEITLEEFEPPKVFTIPDEIRTLYTNTQDLAQDVCDYLYIAASCWSYRNGSFQKSILKKTTAQHPALNNVAYKAYGFDCDKYLEELILDNKWYIEECWERQSGLKKIQ